MRKTIIRLGCGIGKDLRKNNAASIQPFVFDTSTGKQKEGLSAEEKTEAKVKQFLKDVDPIYFKPKPIEPTHNHHVLDLVVYGFDAQKLNLYADFATRAANALNIPSSGPLALPTDIKRWTVRKSPFVHKKKDCWEQRTHFRKVSLFDAHPDVLDHFVHYVMYNQGHGVNAFFERITREELGVGTRMFEEALAKVKDQAKTTAGSSDTSRPNAEVSL